jgi:hypothetical protein
MTWTDEFEVVPDEKVPGPDVPRVSHWNYRIIETEDPAGNKMRGVHEVFYDENDNPIGHTKNAVGVQIDNDMYDDPNEEIVNTLDRMKQAAEKPVLVYDDSKEIYIEIK